MTAILIKKKRKEKFYPGVYGQTHQHRRDYRLALLMIFFALFGLAIISRLVKLQIIEHPSYLAIASGQHEIFKQLYPNRGTIYEQDTKGQSVDGEQQLYPVATNKSMYLLYAVPKDIQDIAAVMQVLKEVFEVKDEKDDKKNVDLENADQIVSEPENEVEKNVAIESEEQGAALIENWLLKLNKKDDPYEPLKHLVSEEQIEKIKQYNLEGISWTKELSRYYPEKNIGSQVIGFVGKQAENNMLKGYYGIEGCYDKDLAGDSGFLRSELDNFGRWIAVAGRDFRKAEDGHDLVLTIEKSVQYFACDQLNKYVVQFGAENGSLIAMDTSTGAIIAMCVSPDYDPNEYNKVEEINIFNNLAISNSYEPGSVMKPITMAAALDTGKVDPFTGYQDTGELIISGYSIKNSDLKANGWQTMTQVLEKSLNTGAVFAARQVGLSEFKRYMEGFGFGKKTDFDLCHESEGNISSLNDSNEIYLATASFGQGITVTSLQLVRAFAAIANEGKLVKPYIVDSIIDNEGKIIMKTSPIVSGQVISAQTAKLLGSMMVSVVNSGHAKKAAVKGYLVAGKTGTAQVPDLEKGGYGDKTIHTFAGFVPFNKPKFAMVIRLDNPSAVSFAADSTAPIFSKIAKFILDYYEVPPEVK